MSTSVTGDRVNGRHPEVELLPVLKPLGPVTERRIRQARSRVSLAAVIRVNAEITRREIAAVRGLLEARLAGQ